MDKVVTNPKGFNAEALARIAPTLQPIADAGDLSGFVTLLFRHGEIAQINTIGQRDVTKKLPMERDTLFRIASMTKPVTSIAALMLMEEGKFKLDDPITKFAPEFKTMRVLKDAQGPLDQTVPAEREITFDDIFTHRSGLAYGFSSLGPIAHEYAAVRVSHQLVERHGELGDTTSPSYFERRIRLDKNWLKSVNEKAISRNISLDSMIFLDAKWMSGEARKKR